MLNYPWIIFSPSLLPTYSPPPATAINEDTIILSPPTTLTVQEGEPVTVPCVASGTQPMFMFGGSDLPTGAQSNQYSLDFAAIAPESNGSYSCQAGSTTFSINVLGRLHHIMPSPYHPLALTSFLSLPLLSLSPLSFLALLPSPFLSL